MPSFRVQGIDISDPSNPAFYDARPAPHGEVRIVKYESKAIVARALVRAAPTLMSALVPGERNTLLNF